MTLLPDPLSPTTPSVSPRSRVNDDAANRLHRAASCEELDPYAVHFEQRVLGGVTAGDRGGCGACVDVLRIAHRSAAPDTGATVDAYFFSRSCGSSITRNQLLSRLTDSTVRLRRRPG